MKRFTVIVAVLVVVVGMTGCVLPPGPGHISPKIVSLELSPGPVTAGESFTIDVTATDDAHIWRFDVWVTAPHLTEQHTRIVICDIPTFTPAPAVSLTITCPVPTIAPNGTWSVRVRAHDGLASNNQTTSIAVVGGTDDVDAPVLESLEISADPVVVGEPFTVTMVVSDEHLFDPYPTEVNLPFPRPVTFLYGRHDLGDARCGVSSIERLSSTTERWVFECPGTDAVLPGRVTGLVAAGLHHPHGAYFEDAIGNRSGFQRGFDVVAP